MRKLKLFLSMLMLIAFSVGNVWAAEELKATIDFSSNDFSIPTSKTVAENTYTHDGISMTLTGTSGNGYAYYSKDKYLLNGKQGATITFSAFEWKTTKIVVTGRSGASSSTKMNIFVGENAVSTETTGCTGTNTYNIASTSQAAGTIYTLKVTSAHNAQFTKFEIYGESSDTPAKTLTSIAVSGTPTKTSYYAGDNFDPAGLTVTGTYSDASTAPITSGITWSYNPSQELALNQTSIGVVATVSEIASAEHNVTGLTVSAAPAAVNYEKVTAAPEDWSGEYLLVYESGTTARVWTGADAANCYVEATISDDVIAKPEGAATLTIAAITGGYSLLINGGTNDGKYITDNANNAALKFADAAYAATISYETDWTKILFSQRCIRYNSSSGKDRFRYYAATNQQAVQLYKKVGGSVKPAAGLAFETSAYLVKANGSLATPTLSTADGFDGTVTYASSDADVVAVNTTTGALTIKAAGKAEITASSLETENFKAGSAKYTIYVAEQAGTAEDPLTEASAKALIDLGCTMNAHVAGTVASQDATYYTVTLSDGFKFWNVKDLGNQDFTSAYLVAGDEVTAYGQLTKYNSNYELATGCYLTAYTEHTTPKTPIVSDIDNPITVAAAIGYIDDPVTYDLTDDVWVRGVVTYIGQTNGQSPKLYIDVKDANEDNTFRFFDYTVNSSITQTPQVNDILIATGKLDKYNTTYELNVCEVVYLERPEVAVTSVELDQNAASIEVNETVTLHATINPDNASNKSITWTVESGNDKASVADGVVTGLVAGEAVIRAASTADPTKYAECTVTVTAVDPTVHHVTFIAGTDKSDETSITKDGITISATTFNNDSYYQCYANSAMTVSSAVGNITKIELTCTASGTAKYGPGNWDFTGYSYDGTNGSWAGSAETVEFGTASQQVRMTLITVTYKEDSRAEAGLAWNPADDIEITVGDAFSAPALLNPNNIAAAEITIASNNTDLATVTNGVVELVADATGEAKITATFAGNDNYKPATVSYNITVNAAAPVVLTDYYEKVTETAGITDGTYLIVYEDGNVAFNGGLETLDAESNTIAVEITNDHKIGVTEATAAATFFIDVTAGSIQAANGQYIGVSSNSNGLKTSDDASTYTNAFAIDNDGNAVISAVFSESTMTMRYNSANNQARFRYYKNGQQSIALYKLANEVVKANPELAWSGDVEITLGDDFTAPTLDNPHSVEGITFASDNTDLATVTNAGVIELIENATGTAHITASFAGDDDYKAMSATCTITVNAAPTPATTKNVVIIAEYNSKFYAMSTTLDNKAFKAVEVEKDGDKIVVFAEADKVAIQWKMTDNTTTATFQDADDKYLAHTGTGTDLTLQAGAEDWTWDSENGYYYAVANRTFFYNNSGVFKNYSTSNLPADKTDYSGAPEIIEIAAENIVVTSKVDPQLAYTPAEVTLTVVDAFTPATLTYVEGFDGLEEVTYASNNEAVATVDESGVVSLVADAIGTATITATFAGNNNYLAGSASYTITVNEAGDDLSGSWVLATAVPAVGQKVIIAATYQNETKAMGIQNSNNRAAVASTLEDDVLTPGAGTKVFTLVDAGDGKFAIQASNGNYLSAAGTGTSNYLKEAENFDEDNAKWTITIENGEANIVASSNNRNVLRYNSGNTIFSCYQSGAQRAINIYVQDTYTRALEPNSYYTVCLPKKMMEVRGASFWTLSSRNEAGSMAYLEEVDPTTAEAGTPFIIQATDTKLEVVYTGAATTTAGTNGALRGTLNGIDAEAFAALPGNPYLLINNAIRPRTTGNFLAANRAYIEYSALDVNTPQPAPGRRVRAVPMQQNTATGMENVQGDNVQCTKVLIDGQLFILRGEKMYDAKGQLVK